ncbi:cysteine synthase family protein [Variovorax sp. PAMC26660]|uniref:cysteine synthase family protein n=1 Tax=Variovorax sp. PAMC26660 TaxID=2762322 RepID=UPI00164E942D|nr:cysteine synthase family protein [Variovorax sp. PAMC26660]QNK65929.1 cysteine synthase family protein [Variovorax sp. PAMC26660]
MLKIRSSLPEIIGNTPVLRLQNDLIPKGKSLYLKMETFNPTCSIKDRTAYALILAGIASGQLKEGSTIIESTSGNLGKSLAMLGAAMGFKVIIVVDPKVSRQNLSIYEAFGAQVVVVDTLDENGGYQRTRLKKVQDLLKTVPDAYWPNQYDNASNRKFHSDVTAEEILDLNVEFDTVIGSVSTGGHLCGIAEKLKLEKPNTKIVAVDAMGSAIFQGKYKPHLMNGLGLSWRTRNVNTAVLDEYMLIGDTEAFSMCRHLAKTSGLLLGGSSGAVILSALRQLHLGSARSALCIVADSGWNYLDQLYDDNWLERHDIELMGPGELLAGLEELHCARIDESSAP